VGGPNINVTQAQNTKNMNGTGIRERRNHSIAGYASGLALGTV